MNQYRHSGAVPLGGAVLAVVMGGLTSVVLSSVYSWLVHFIPIIYANFLCTAGLGCGIGYAIGKAGLLGHIRNNFVLVIVAAVMAVIGLYFAWAGYVMAVFAGEWFIEAFDPLVIWDRMTWAYENGTWGIGKGGNNVSGILLGIVWVIEAFAIIALAIITAKSVGGSTPYCENCSTWTKLAKSVRILSATGEEPYWQQVVQGELITINQAPVGEDGLGTNVHLDLATCPQCQAMNVLTIRKVTKSLDNKDKESTAETVLAQDLLINTKEAEFVHLCGMEEAPEAVANEEGDREGQEEQT